MPFNFELEEKALKVFDWFTCFLVCFALSFKGAFNTTVFKAKATRNLLTDQKKSRNRPWRHYPASRDLSYRHEEREERKIWEIFARTVASPTMELETSSFTLQIDI